MRWILLRTIGVLAVLFNSFVNAAPVIVDPGWSITRTVGFSTTAGVAYNPMDGLIYAARVTGTGTGFYRIESNDSLTQIAANSSLPWGVVVDPDDGDVFFSTAASGFIYRVPFGTTSESIWASGFHSGDDDPLGMAIAPNGYTGGVISPGDGLVADEGSNGLDEIWRFSPDTAEGETVLHADNGTLIAAYDVAISNTDIFVVDRGSSTSNPGVIYSVGSGGVLTALTTSESLFDPVSIAIHPVTGELYIGDFAGDERLVKVDPDTGVVTEIATNMKVTGLDFTPDGSRLIVADRLGENIYEFSATTVPVPAAAWLFGSALGLLGWMRRKRA